jgi:hypothetical protein
VISDENGGRPAANLTLVSTWSWIQWATMGIALLAPPFEGGGYEILADEPEASLD